MLYFDFIATDSGFLTVCICFNAETDPLPRKLSAVESQPAVYSYRMWSERIQGGRYPSDTLQ